MQSRKDLISGLVLLALAAGYILYALQYPYPVGTLNAPGLGLVPIAVGTVLLLLSARLVLSGLVELRAAGAEEASVGTERAVFPQRPLLTTVLLVAYIYSLQWTGFVINTFLLVLIGARVMGATSWRKVLALAVGTAVASYLVFVVLLNVPLPQGLILPLGER